MHRTLSLARPQTRRARRQLGAFAFNSVALSVGAAALLVACGGGGSSGGGGTGGGSNPPVTNSVSGSVIEAGAVQGATVCLDLDGKIGRAHV